MIVHRCCYADCVYKEPNRLRNSDCFIVGRLLGPVQLLGRFGQPTIFRTATHFFDETRTVTAPCRNGFSNTSQHSTWWIYLAAFSTPPLHIPAYSSPWRNPLERLTCRSVASSSTEKLLLPPATTVSQCLARVRPV